MHFIIWANDVDWNSLTKAAADNKLMRVYSAADFLQEKNADAYFNLMDDSYTMDYTNLDKPIFINSIVYSLEYLQTKPNVLRLNGWAGFIEKNIWEIAGSPTAQVESILHAFKKNFIVVPDTIGLVSPIVIAMIINEAYLAFEDGVSTKEDIDIAMKLGTAYPFGPFEWGDKIGLKHITQLLLKLSEQNERYLPAKSLQLTHA